MKEKSKQVKPAPKDVSNACPRPMQLQYANTQGPDMLATLEGGWQNCQQDNSEIKCAEETLRQESITEQISYVV